jgi:uncharacterized membrane protein YbaN (DUF454 family)
MWTVGRVKALLSVLGFVSVAAGIIGFFVPLWPSTVFFIIALALFAKSNPEAERKLLEHPRIGPVLRDWRSDHSIARKTKVTASVLIAVTIGVSICLSGFLWLRGVLVVVAISLIVYLCTRPEPKAYQADQSKQIV